MCFCLSRLATFIQSSPDMPYINGPHQEKERPIVMLMQDILPKMDTIIPYCRYSSFPFLLCPMHKALGNRLYTLYGLKFPLTRLISYHVCPSSSIRVSTMEVKGHNRARLMDKQLHPVSCVCCCRDGKDGHRHYCSYSIQQPRGNS